MSMRKESRWKSLADIILYMQDKRVNSNVVFYEEGFNYLLHTTLVLWNDKRCKGMVLEINLARPWLRTEFKETGHLSLQQELYSEVVHDVAGSKFTRMPIILIDMIDHCGISPGSGTH